MAVPAGKTRLLLEHFRIDENHSNSYTVWNEIGSPQEPTPQQCARLESAGRLEWLESPAWIPVTRGAARLDFSLPRHDLSLLRLSW